jgi:hypothetical protein
VLRIIAIFPSSRGRPAVHAYQNSDPASPFRCLAGSIAAARSRARAAIGFMVWLWISAVIVLRRGELNADPEHQTARKGR